MARRFRWHLFWWPGKVILVYGPETMEARQTWRCVICGKIKGV